MTGPDGNPISLLRYIYTAWFVPAGRARQRVAALRRRQPRGAVRRPVDHGPQGHLPEGLMLARLSGLFGNRPRLPRPVWLVSWTSFFTDTASEAVYPIMPLYLTRTLGGTAMDIGIIEGAAEALNSVLKIATGRTLRPVERAQAVRDRGLWHLDPGPSAGGAGDVVAARARGAADRSRRQGHPFGAARCAAGVVGRSVDAGLRLRPASIHGSRRRHRRAAAGEPVPLALSRTISGRCSP